MSLPLQERATDNGLLFLLTPQDSLRTPARPNSRTRISERPPDAGEQYRFHFDMTKCIGCRCCEVACNEQNNNPAGIHWRRVGEIEAGSYPLAQRFYLSMGCNHCLEPSCLIGCPVDAYKKDPITGVVVHSAEACIGCQYCTWNCPYAVPQYNPERGVVGKCDMCHVRLSDGREPACVSACPQGAIEIETVNLIEWTRQHAAADAPGLPAADQTISTTRITLPVNLPGELQKADEHRLRPEHSHMPLVFMTVLTQLSAGAFVALWLLGMFAKSAALEIASAALGVSLVSLGASTFHLGRPAYAYRALKMWKRSWLSREVLLFGLFSITASLYAGLLRAGAPAAGIAGALTALFGFAGVTASAFIYLVPARPAWDSKHTIAEFYLTALLLGSLLVTFSFRPMLPFAIAAAFGQFLNQLSKFLWLVRADEFELRSSARLLSTTLGHMFLARLTLLGMGGILLPLLGQPIAALLMAAAGELLGRYLFFVSVVPKNMPASFFSQKEAA